MMDDPIPYDIAARLFQRLDKAHVLMEILDDGTKVVVQKKRKPYAVLINSFGFELLDGKLRLFKWSRGRVALDNPNRQVPALAKRFASVCQAYGVLKTPRKPTRKPTRAATTRARVAAELLKALLWAQAERSKAIAQQRVELACLEPEAYVERRRDALEQRGIRNTRPDLHVIALVEVLLSAHVLAEIDWRAEPREVKKALRRRLMTRELERVWPANADLSASDLLRAVSKKLPSVGKRLLLLNLHDDSLYPLVVEQKVANQLLANLRRFGARVGKA